MPTSFRDVANGHEEDIGIVILQRGGEVLRDHFLAIKVVGGVKWQKR